MLEDGGVVEFGGVAFVAIPAIVRVEFMLRFHVFVAVGFGEDRGGGDSLVFGVAFNDAEVWNIVLADEAVAVDEQELGSGVELRDGEVHGMYGGAEDVDTVNLVVVDGSDSPCNGIVFNIMAESQTLFGSELLGVVEERVAVVVRQDDGGGIDRAGKTTASSLVATSFGEFFIIEWQ